MKITMIGTGYVGLVTGTCFAESGNDVTCLDVDQRKVDLLNRGGVPIYEPGLEELVKRNASAGRLKFTTDYKEAISNAKCVFICVGTPQDESGAADLKYVQAAAESMAPFLKPGAIVICKSTVPVGTNRRVAGWISAKTSTKFSIASNPEFLKEGAAIDDFTKPDRVVVGVDEADAADVLQELYKPFLRTEKPFIVVGIESAEMIKYAANCMLATKISFINEMANICERVGADINEVRKGLVTMRESDSRSCSRASATAVPVSPKMSVLWHHWLPQMALSLEFCERSMKQTISRRMCCITNSLSTSEEISSFGRLLSGACRSSPEPMISAKLHRSC